MKVAVYKVESGKATLMEIVDAKSVKEVRRIRTMKYMDIVTSGTAQLWIGSKKAADEHFK